MISCILKVIILYSQGSCRLQDSEGRSLKTLSEFLTSCLFPAHHQVDVVLVTEEWHWHSVRIQNMRQMNHAVLELLQQL